MKSFHYKFHYELVIKARGDYCGFKMIVSFFSPPFSYFLLERNLCNHLHEIHLEHVRGESNTLEISRGGGVIRARNVLFLRGFS